MTRSRETDLSVGETAEALSVSKKTIYREILAGHLAAFWVGGRLRIRADELEAYRERRRVEKASGSA